MSVGAEQNSSDADGGTRPPDHTWRPSSRNMWLLRAVTVLAFTVLAPSPALSQGTDRVEVEWGAGRRSVTVSNRCEICFCYGTLLIKPITVKPES